MARLQSDQLRLLEAIDPRGTPPQNLAFRDQFRPESDQTLVRSPLSGSALPSGQGRPAC